MTLNLIYFNHYGSWIQVQCFEMQPQSEQSCRELVTTFESLVKFLMSGSVTYSNRHNKHSGLDVVSGERQQDVPFGDLRLFPTPMHLNEMSILP